MILAIIAGALVGWLALALVVALLFGRVVRMAETKHRDAVFLRDSAAPRREAVDHR